MVVLYLSLREEDPPFTSLSVERELDTARLGLVARHARTSGSDARHGHVHVHIHAGHVHIHSGHVHVDTRGR